MFRLFKLYSLFMDNTGFSASQKSCKCEKLPRAMIHVPVSRFNVCEICGMTRRPPTCSSDEEEKLDAERQKILLQRRHAEEAAHSNKTARFKVAIKGKKPQVKSNSRRSKNDDWARTEGGGLGEAGDGDGDGPKEASKMGRRQQEPSAPPPSSPSPAPSGCEDMFSNYPRRRLIYDDQFVKKFIPLKGPITDPSGGAISKRSGNIWGAPNPHISRPQGPLFKDKLQGGGSNSSKSKGKYTESQLASQFPPFDEYDGPSEDAFVVDNARRMLNRPNSLYMEPRPDLPNNRIGSHESSLGRIWCAPHTMPSVPAPKIPEPSSVPFTNKSPLSEEIKADIKEGHKSSNTSSSPIYQQTKSEEYPGIDECEEILQSLGLIELSHEMDGTIFNELADEDVVASNKTMTDEEYLDILSKKWGTHSRESIITGALKASQEKIYWVKYQEESDTREKFEDCETSKKIQLAKLPSRKFKNSQERAYPVSRRKYYFKNPFLIINQSIAPRKSVKVAPVAKKLKSADSLFTRKLETFEKVQNIMSRASYVRQLSGKLSVSCVQRQPHLDCSKVVANRWQGTSPNSNHEAETSGRLGNPIPPVANPKEQMTLNARSDKKLIKGGGQISETKCLPFKCSQCRRPVKNKAENNNRRKILKDIDLEKSKLKSDSKRRVCPVHSDTEKRYLCRHRILNNRSENLEIKKAISKIPVIKMEKTLKMLVFTRKLKTFYKVYHTSVDLPQLHLVFYVRQLSEILLKSYVQNQHTKSFLEFRVPDLETSYFFRRDPQTLKPRSRAVWPSMRAPGVYAHQKKKLIQKEVVKRECKLEKRSQEQEQKRARSPVPVPEANQASESERKMIKAIVKHFRSINKPLKKSRGF